MDANGSPKVSMASTTARQFPHPSPLPPARKPVSDTLSSFNQGENKQDPINGLFLTQLTRIFALKYALSMASSRLLDASSTSANSKEIREELRQMLEDLKRVQKWIDTTTKQAEKALHESVQPPPLQPKPSSVSLTQPHRFRQLLSAVKSWFERVSTI